MEIEQPKIRQLRKAIRENRASFPSQAPVFARQSRSGIQWRLALLYFVRGWSCVEIGRRYGLTAQRIQQLVTRWAERAVTLGYIQAIPLEAAAHTPETLTLSSAA